MMTGAFKGALGCVRLMASEHPEPKSICFSRFKGCNHEN
jgi:hypothetical protein